MTSISLHVQWPPTSFLHGSFSQREQLIFSLRIKQQHAKHSEISNGRRHVGISKGWS
jgi:hypothetical protein